MAGDFLANYLPEKIVKHIDLDRLKIQSGSFVDRDLQEHYSDVLYEVGVKEDKIMTIAQELFEKGMKEGMQQGMQQGQISTQKEVLLRLLRKKFTLSEEDSKYIQQVNNLERLNRALDEILVAKSKNDVLRHLQ